MLLAAVVGPCCAMSNGYQQLLGWALAAVATGIIVPQLVRVIRTGSDDGVSVPTVGLAAGAVFAWMGFTWQHSDIPAFASSLGPFVVWFTTGYIVSKRRRCLPQFLGGLGVVVGTIAYLGMHYQAFAAIAVTGSLCWIVPQVRTAVRVRNLAGVSIAAYTLLFAESVGWFTYAVCTATPAYAIAPVVQGPLAVVVAVSAYRSRRHAHTDSINHVACDQLLPTQ